MAFKRKYDDLETHIAHLITALHFLVNPQQPLEKATEYPKLIREGIKQYLQLRWVSNKLNKK
jgi:hypothetical protein